MSLSDKRPRLLFLDGIRGLCAVYIACHHAQLYAGHYISTSSLYSALQPISRFFSLGYLAVPIFIVLSGYCLAIPVVLTGEPRLKHGFLSYIKRRAKRILPPYYFALALFIVLILAVPVLQKPGNTAWDSKIPLTYQAVLSHIFLVHNLSSKWIFKIDGPLWSVATEWQLYFLMPLLLYIWKRLNLVAVVILAILPAYILPAFISSAKFMHIQYLGLFASGILGANISFSTNARWLKIRQWNWRLITNIFGIVTILVLSIFSELQIGIINMELLVGLTTCVVIVYYASEEIAGLKKPLGLQLLNRSSLIGLGIFSYSIYLVHSPLLGLINLLTLKIPMENSIRWLFMEGVAVPASIALSYLFYLAVERNSINAHTAPKVSQSL